ncbi:MAG: hypothetical protein GF341_10100 [candidate division Zixibacteria bacterium]|nr:hypothetical protein [candidate division Zixibacteria bacterium]
MTVTFLTVGKPTKGWAADAVAHYTKFLSKYAKVDIDHVKPVSGRDRTDADVCHAESERIVDRLAPHKGAAVIVCDNRGQSSTSEDFAGTVRDLLDTHGGHIVIIIGGACGVNETVLSRAAFLWSFGPMTLPHDLALITAMEQTARAFSIDRGEAYHK